MKRLSIRWQLTLWYALALAVMLCAFSFLLCLLVWQQVLSRTDNGLREELREIGLEVALTDSATTFASQAAARFSQHDFYEFLVTDVNGNTIFSSSTTVYDMVPKAADSPDGQFQTVPLEGLGPYRIASTRMDSTFGKLNVQVMTSLQPLYNDQASLQWVVALLLPIAVLLAIASGQFLAGRALRQVQQVVDETHAIDISNLDRRIPVSNPDDEIGQLTIALNSLIARLERAINEIRRFTADASHEIRTPLATLRLEAESALRSPRTPEEYQQTLAVVLEETTRLGKLSDQLLNLSRHDAGIIPCQQDPVQLDALLLDVIEQIKPLAEAGSLSLSVNINSHCEILGDDISLSQVFFNLLENAIKYTAAGGEVAVELSCQSDEALIEITDTGIGVAAENLPYLFDRFYQADPSRSSSGGGSGLGLSIARAAVLMHAGSIEIQSQPGEGTRVSVRLPVSSQADPSRSDAPHRLTV
ncbi:Sensor kinase CusS [Gimesia panareensis]|uniref:histidine kinase n=1 Tax=Gimesia panareensis TaxID=2527978 RepID=A0A518FLP4_9PLAN|nr:ATP-binding protein [Gimesia panareensis]QDV17273.1 Sensor kinase CusS [Gimesia panareensis]